MLSLQTQCSMLSFNCKRKIDLSRCNLPFHHDGAGAHNPNLYSDTFFTASWVFFFTISHINEACASMCDVNDSKGGKACRGAVAMCIKFRRTDYENV